MFAIIFMHDILFHYVNNLIVTRALFYLKKSFKNVLIVSVNDNSKLAHNAEITLFQEK